MAHRCGAAPHPPPPVDRQSGRRFGVADRGGERAPRRVLSAATAMRRRATAAALLLLAAGGCSAGGFTRSRTTMPGMPCSEAARVARGALLRLGYEGEVVTAPQPGTPGQVVGHKAGGYDYVTHAPTRRYTATVTITCANAGATFDAVTDEPLPGSLTFKSDFVSMVGAVAARRIQRPRLASQVETGMVIAIEPLRAGEARGELGVNLPAAGVTPVRVTLTNRSERTYAFAAERVRLEQQEGGRVAPLAATEAARRAGDAAAAVAERQIANGVIAPGATVSGLIYVPAAAYRRATVVLIDQESEEEEGFSVEF